MAWLIRCLALTLISFQLLSVSTWAFANESTEVVFEKKKIRIGQLKIDVELAKTNEQQQRGLMYRKSLKDNDGMLFVFDREDYRTFWMKNTWIDLSIGYFDKNRILKEIIDMKATSSLEVAPPSYPNRFPAQYALEMNKGWFSKNKIKIGDKFNWD
jgi:uncharacterized membrane protein (UPF0127 family)